MLEALGIQFHPDAEGALVGRTGPHHPFGSNMDIRLTPKESGWELRTHRFGRMLALGSSPEECLIKLGQTLQASGSAVLLGNLKAMRHPAARRNPYRLSRLYWDLGGLQHLRKWPHGNH